MTTKRRVRIKSLVCPECGEVGTLRRIVYGMPDPDTLNHSVGEEWSRLQQTLNTEEKSPHANNEEGDRKDCMEDIFDQIYILQWNYRRFDVKVVLFGYS